jgi:hypothetical protein
MNEASDNSAEAVHKQRQFIPRRGSWGLSSLLLPSRGTPAQISCNTVQRLHPHVWLVLQSFDI